MAFTSAPRRPTCRVTRLWSTCGRGAMQHPGMGPSEYCRRETTLCYMKCLFQPLCALLVASALLQLASGAPRAMVPASPAGTKVGSSRGWNQRHSRCACGRGAMQHLCRACPTTAPTTARCLNQLAQQCSWMALNRGKGRAVSCSSPITIWPCQLHGGLRGLALGVAHRRLLLSSQLGPLLPHQRAHFPDKLAARALPVLDTK